MTEKKVDAEGAKRSCPNPGCNQQPLRPIPVQVVEGFVGLGDAPPPLSDKEWECPTCGYRE